MDHEISARLKWVQLYEEIGNAGLVCRRCGISRPALRKWWRRYQAQGHDGLKSQSRRPKTSPAQKLDPTTQGLILGLRSKRKLGARRIQSELARLHGMLLSLATIHKALSRNQVRRIRFERRKAHYKRYERPIPGERVQMDTCKIAPGLYQYTAVDDCTRYRVLALFDRRTAANTLEFIDQVLEEMPLPIQRFQTDRGREFFAQKVQRRMMELAIKFRPIKPRSPHLNGKVERSQRTDLEEFYPNVDLTDSRLHDLLAEWQHYYNWHRPHGAHRGRPPMDKFFEVIHDTPYWDDVYEKYDAALERIQEADYQLVLHLRKLKRCL
ncbi:MAG: IS481 family transposase [Gammaproteobacteria bacterium]|nr:IS481 family transposase [Gammaproteobacteria bacterium]